MFSESGFANIRIESAGGEIVSYQAIVRGVAGHQKRLLKKDALKEALAERNSMYKKEKTLCEWLLRRIAVGGISETVSLDGRNKEGEKKAVPCWRIQCRNLETGLPHQREIRFISEEVNPDNEKKRKKKRRSSYKLKRPPLPSKDRALKQAQVFERSNLGVYNRMVETLNDQIIKEGIKLAEIEFKTLTPRLHELEYGYSSRWSEIFDDFFPDGLSNPIDPHSPDLSQRPDI